MAVASGSKARPKAPSEGPASTSRALGGRVMKLVRSFLTLREGSIVVVAIVTIVYFSTNATNFATLSNFKTLLPYFGRLAILAAGEVFVMINGEIDLSIGAVYLLSPFIFYNLANAGVPLVPAVILSLLASGLVGLINGLFVAVVGISSFVTAL